MGTSELSGERVRLRTTSFADRDRLIEIRQTDEVRSRWPGDDLAADFAESLTDDEVHQLTILDGDDHIVGMIQFAEEHDPEYRSASVDLFVDPAFHRRGYATDAIRTLLDHLFDERGHHRVTIDPAADNIAAIECYRSVGFRTVGVMRQYERRRDGTWADGLLMDMLATDRRSRPDGPTPGPA